MLDTKTFKDFIGEANRTHQKFCVWFYFHNQLVKHQDRWNKFNPVEYFALENFDKTKGAKYKNFWSVTLASTQHGWILGTARLFDPAFHSRDSEKEKPRISLNYILQRLDDRTLATRLREESDVYKDTIGSIRKHRDNVLAHNDAEFKYKKIEAGIENLFEWLEEVISKIKVSERHLSECGVINVKYNEKLSQCGVDEVFNTLLLGEKYENN